MEKLVPDVVTRAFLLSNLVESTPHDARDSAHAFRWRLHLGALRHFVPKILAMEFPPSTPPSQLPTLFLVGGRSDYVQPADHARIKQLFPKAEIVTIPGAGHWLHSEQPAAFADAVSRWLETNKPFS